MSATDLVIRLHAAASKTEPDYLLTDSEGLPYDPLFGEYVAPRLGGRR
ncbi:hypothetical protein [Actinacidiphila acidipaludis]|uniref:Uncharacterized protein n=1 Tax=Actinacidiphila acidipaludis TaxID=2873382 RepID=A0ABS7PZ49_9ACTN|nr:hypothetical protein [Streptomyces acidipaludis]MBY8876162.1 hypothetical protein [Streptomyces acidipaludis]